MRYRIVEHTDIDKQWWDEQIKMCANSRIYAQSWFLDIVSPNWKACIIGDNQAFIPITIHKVAGIFSLWIQPMFCQQLGLFYKQSFESKTNWVKPISRKFLFTQIHSNSEALVNAKVRRSNYILPLNLSYEDLLDGYSKDAKKNLKKYSAFRIEPSEINENYLKRVALSLYFSIRNKASFWRTRTRKYEGITAKSF